MHVYDRQVVKRVDVNYKHPTGWILVKEMIRTDNIDKYNYRKKVKFEIGDLETSIYLDGLSSDFIFTKKLKDIEKR